jgi:hypothetical protein
MLALTYEQRDAEQRVATRTARLLEVYHAAKRLTDGMKRIGNKEYEVEPAAVLSLRTTLTEAGLFLLKERRLEK